MTEEENFSVDFIAKLPLRSDKIDTEILPFGHFSARGHPLATVCRHCFLIDGRVEIESNVAERRSGHKTTTLKNVLFAGSDRRWATVATLQTAKMNDVETPLSPLSYLVAFKTFLLVPPRINNEVPRCSLGALSGIGLETLDPRGFARPTGDRRDHFFVAPTHQARVQDGEAVA